MQRIKKLLDITSSKKGLIILGVLIAISGTSLGITLQQIAELSNGNSIPDFAVGYSSEFIQNLFQSYGEKGMELYRRVHLIDLFNPAIYAMLLASLSYLFFKETKWERLAIVPLIVGLLDYLENFFLFNLLNDFPQVNDSMVQISNVISLIKHPMLYLAILLFLIGLGKWIAIRIRAK